MLTRLLMERWPSERTLSQWPGVTSGSGAHAAGTLTPLVRATALFSFVSGCTVSILASGRFTPRLILDGAVSFAFVPVFTVAAFAVIWALGDRRLPLSRALGLFAANNHPWLWWFWIVALAGALVPPRAFWPWVLPLLLAGGLAIFWSLYVDYTFLRDVMRRSATRAAADLVLHRALAWTGIVFYFLGYAFRPDVIPQLRIWLGQ